MPKCRQHIFRKVDFGLPEIGAQEIHSEKTEKLEYRCLLEIHDNYPKYVLRTDEFAGGNYEGIKTMHIADFLLSSEY